MIAYCTTLTGTNQKIGRDEMTHTPGPWKVIELDGDLYINPKRESGEYWPIARILPSNRGQEGNARLIASAPEMLELLRCVESLPSTPDQVKKAIRELVEK